jgi:hypothetical protein
MRVASAPFHYAPAARWTRRRAAPDLGRYAPTADGVACLCVMN